MNQPQRSKLLRYQFEKLQGLGNDFMLLDARRQQDNVKLPPLPATISRWADRHTGVGFDQFIYLAAGANGLHYRFYNADGTEAQQCGNGQRAIALYLHSQKELSKNTTVYGAGGSVKLAFKDPDHITVTINQPYKWQPQKLSVLGEKLTGYFVDVGNPHWLYLSEDVSQEALAEKAAEITTNFAAGTNVEALQVDNEGCLSIRIFERGAGETLACGSGACAAAVVAHHELGMGKEIAVNMPGGCLHVALSEGCDTISFTGPARRVYQGIIYE